MKVQVHATARVTEPCVRSAKNVHFSITIFRDTLNIITFLMMRMPLFFDFFDVLLLVLGT